MIEELSFGLRQMGATTQETQALAQDVLARFQRLEWETRPVHGLSQGQRHLVCMMAVLAMAPKVLLLDEPFAGLDLPTRLHLTRILEALDLTVLFITHQTELLQDYDRVLWLEGGTVAADGPPAQVLPQFEAEMRVLGGQDALADH